MARTGRFGRLPRAAPNLTSIIIALVREQNAQEDSNILKAWDEGGEFEGQPVTDTMLLDHIRGRRDGIGRTDPLWDRWNVMLDNYSFAIEESKMSLAYAQHGVNEMQMADFYTTWAGKLPPESEAYRNLMRSAAQFLDSAKAKAEAAANAGRRGGGGGGGGGGSRSGGSQDSYNAAALGAYDRYERQYDTATQILLAAAYREGILQITDTADPDDLNDLRGGDEQDHARFLNLFDQINTDPRMADVRTALAEEGLENLTYGGWLALADSKAGGIEARVNLAVQFDDASGAEDLREDLTQFTTERALFNDIDETAAYQVMRRQFDQTLTRPGMTPWQVADAIDRYSRGLDALDASAASDQTRGFLNNERRALRGEDIVGPSAYEQNEGGIRKTNNDVGQLSQLVRETASRIQAVESGQAYLATAVGADGLQTYDIVPRGTPGLNNPGLGMVVWTSVGRNRPPVPTYVRFNPIFSQAAAARDPRTGRPTVEVASEQDQLVGQYYVLNGKTYYGVYTEGSVGDLTWFADDPFVVGQQARSFGDDGSLVLNFDLPSSEDPEQGFDPTRVIDPVAMDMGLPRAARFDNADEALYYTDTNATRALLQVSDQQAAQLIAELHGDTPEGAARWDNFRTMRNTAVGLANHEYGLIQMENARLGLGPDPDMPARTGRFGPDLFERTGESEREARGRAGYEAGAQGTVDRIYLRERQRALLSNTSTRRMVPGGEAIDLWGNPIPGSTTDPTLMETRGRILPNIQLPNLLAEQLPGRGIQPIDSPVVGNVKPVRTAPRPRQAPRASQPIETAGDMQAGPLATPRPAPAPISRDTVTPTTPRMLDEEEDLTTPTLPTIRTPNLTTSRSRYTIR